MNFKVVINSGLFLPEELIRVNNAVQITNDELIVPRKDTGELIIGTQFGGFPALIDYHIQLPGGPGKSCAIAKIRTLEHHPEYRCTGQIFAEELAVGEVKWYGSNRIPVTIQRDSAFTEANIYIAFSDRKELQDEVFVAAVRMALLASPRILLRGNDGLGDDPCVSAARQIIADCDFPY